MVKMTNYIAGHHEEKQDDLLEHGERAQIDGRQTGHGQGRVAQEQGIYECYDPCQHSPTTPELDSWTVRDEKGALSATCGMRHGAATTAVPERMWSRPLVCGSPSADTRQGT